VPKKNSTRESRSTLRSSALPIQVVMIVGGVRSSSDQITFPLRNVLKIASLDFGQSISMRVIVSVTPLSFCSRQAAMLLVAERKRRSSWAHLEGEGARWRQ